MDWTRPETPTDENPLVMYFIVRQSLGMGAGKVGAQCAHACQLILIQEKKINKLISLKFPNDLQISKSIDICKNISLRMNYWNDCNINGSFRKVVLRSNEKEWEAIKKSYNPIIVIDAGLTEVEPNTETVMVLWPMFKNERCKILKRLQTLK